MTNTKPREFWIRIPSACDMTEPHHITNVGTSNFWEGQKTIHVIEHSAYAKLEKELADNEKGNRKIIDYWDSKYQEVLKVNADLKKQLEQAYNSINTAIRYLESTGIEHIKFIDEPEYQMLKDLKQAREALNPTDKSSGKE